MLLLALGMRIITVSALVLITAVCLWAFSLIPQSFFPDSNTPLFFVNMELPQGTDIRSTADYAADIEAYILEQEDVVSVASFIGQGATRFMLTYAPEQPNTAYAQFIVRTEDLDAIPALDQRFYRELNDAPSGCNLARAMARASKRAFRGPPRKCCARWPTRPSASWPTAPT